MKQLVYFLIFGLAFTSSQVVTVEAQEGYSGMEPPMCGDVPCPTGDAAGAVLMCDGEPCDPDMTLEGDEAMPPDAVANTIPEGNHRRLPAPEDMGKFFEYDREYRTNGVLSQASYDELLKAGYSKKRVDWILTQIKELLRSRGG